MPTIYKLIPPYKNELMYSYLYQLSQANEITSFNDFMKFYLKPIKRKSNNNYQSYYVFQAFFDSANFNYNPVRFFMEHSIYPFEALFLNPRQQTHLVHQYFGMHTDKYPTIITKNTHSFNIDNQTRQAFETLLQRMKGDSCEQ